MEHMNLLTITGTALCTLAFVCAFFPPMRKRWTLLAPSLAATGGSAALLFGLQPEVVTQGWAAAQGNLAMTGFVAAVVGWGYFWIVDCFNPMEQVTSAVVGETPAPVVRGKVAEVGGEDADAALEQVAVGLNSVALEPEAAQPVAAVVASSEKDLFAKIEKSHGDGRTVSVTFARADGGVAITIRTVQYGQKTFYSLVTSKVETLKNCGWKTDKDPKSNKVRVITGRTSEDRLAEIRAVLKDIG